nr:retrovirus-related Pol polyprotein from transposon TNT 1-94 [Tanacetum cinerariifolium]GEX37519.1 retrovirus-related Pol polyprotein from transposon TNT 1-94 [Tanacetum cinerariifolium]
MTGVKSYLYKCVEQTHPKVVFGDNSSFINEGYGLLNCRGIVFTKVAFVNGLKYNLISISQLCDAKYIVQFDDKQGIIFNANKEINLIAPRRNDVYVLDMSALTLNGACFFAKASESVNWLWHKRLLHLNFKNINKLAKQNQVLGLPSLVYSKDKPCTAWEKKEHHRASFKTKQNFSIMKYLHLLHLDLFGPVNPMSINHEKYTLVIVDDYSRCPMFIHNQKEHLGEFDTKADDRYFLGYSSVLKAFKINNTRRQQIKETYHVTFDESMEAIRFTNTSIDEIGIDDSSRYPPDEFLHEDDQSRKYQVDSDISYYVIPHGRSLIELTQENHIPEVIVSNEHDFPLTEDIKDPPDLINTEETHEQNDQDDQIITQPTNRTEAPKMDDAMQEELNQFYRNKVWTLVPLPYRKIAIGSKWVFRNKKDEHGTTTRNKARQVAQGYSQEEGIDYDETFTLALISKDIQIQTMLVVIWIEKAPQVPTKYLVESWCCASIIWMKSQLSDNNIYYKMVPIFCDNTSAIAISNNPILHSRTKHIDIRYHFIKDHILKGDIKLHFILTEYQLADIFTKLLNEPTFTRLKAELGMLNID